MEYLEYRKHFTNLDQLLSSTHYVFGPTEIYWAVKNIILITGHSAKTWETYAKITRGITGHS